MLNNLILIGMPGAGKSTVGVVLAKRLGMQFMDTDLVIQTQENCTLHEIMDTKGLEAFLQIENQVLCDIEPNSTIVATGGSAVYGREAMQHLKSIGTVLYLELGYERLCERLGDLHERGVVLKPNQTLRQLYEERIPLYEQYADLIIHCDQKEIREIVKEIADRLQNSHE